MTISNLAGAKKKLKAGLPIFLITAGFIFLISSVIAFWNGSVDYQGQKEQLNWPVANATVSYVEEKVEHSNSPGNYGHTFTYYDIHYDYIVGGQVYSGIIEHINKSSNTGHSFEIKYNPAMPNESTHILEPSKSFMTSGSVFAVLAFVLITLSVFIIRKNSKLNTDM